MFFILVVYLLCIWEIHLLDLSGHWISQFSCFTDTVQGSDVILHWNWHSHWVSCPLYHANNVFTFHPHVNMSQVNAVKCKTLLCAALRTASYQVLEAGIVCSWFGIMLHSDKYVPDLSAPNLGLCYKVINTYVSCLHQITCKNFFRLHVPCLYALGLLINLKWLHLHTWCAQKTPLEIHLICLGKKENYLIFVTWCIISVLFFTKCHLFYNFIFLWSSNMFFTNHVLKFIYVPLLLQVWMW